MLNSDAIWIIFTGFLVASSCGLLGSFLVLRRMAMVGDAISHAVLPGIVIGYLVTGSREPWVMVPAAGLLGILTSSIIEVLHQKAGVQSDASIGVTFTFLFAIGVILISMFAGQVDLDQECVLYGEIAYLPLNPLVLANGWSLGPKMVWILMPLLLLISLGIYLFYTPLSLTAFDPAFALSIGIKVGFWHQVLMGAVSFTTVASFDSVGAILVVAFLVVIPSTAWLLSQRLPLMLGLCLLLAFIISVTGYLAASWLNVSISGAMACSSGVLFVLAFLFSPLEGRVWLAFKKKSQQIGAI